MSLQQLSARANESHHDFAAAACICLTCSPSCPASDSNRHVVDCGWHAPLSLCGNVDDVYGCAAYEPPSPAGSQVHEPSATADDLEAGRAHSPTQRAESVAAPTAPLPREQDLDTGEVRWAEDFQPATASRRQRTKEVLVRVASQSADRLAWVGIAPVPCHCHTLQPSHFC